MMMTHLLVAASRLFHIPIKEIIRHRRTQHAVEARQAVAYAARQHGRTLVEIGDALGGRDHTTIMWAVDAAERRAVGDANYASRLAALTQEAKAHA